MCEMYVNMLFTRIFWDVGRKSVVNPEWTFSVVLPLNILMTRTVSTVCGTQTPSIPPRFEWHVTSVWSASHTTCFFQQVSIGESIGARCPSELLFIVSSFPERSSLSHFCVWYLCSHPAHICCIWLFLAVFVLFIIWILDYVELCCFTWVHTIILCLFDFIHWHKCEFWFNLTTLRIQTFSFSPIGEADFFSVNCEGTQHFQIYINSFTVFLRINQWMDEYIDEVRRSVL